MQNIVLESFFENYQYVILYGTILNNILSIITVQHKQVNQPYFYPKIEQLVVLFHEQSFHVLNVSSMRLVIPWG